MIVLLLLLLLLLLLGVERTGADIDRQNTRLTFVSPNFVQALPFYYLQGVLLCLQERLGLNRSV